MSEIGGQQFGNRSKFTYVVLLFNTVKKSLKEYMQWEPYGKNSNILYPITMSD